jgi:hypothetical protein
MNILKQIFAVTAIVAVFALIACGGDDGNGNDDPKDQSQTISLTFGETSPTATVKGHLTDTEWNGVADKIKNAINGAYNGLPTETAKTNYSNLFNTGVVIIIEKTSVYTNWKTTGDGKTIYLNFDAVEKTDLSTLIGLAIRSIGTNGTENG